MKLRMLCLLFLPLWGFSQSEPSEAIIYWRFIESIEVYSMPNGTILTSMQNDHENENYLSLKILAETEDFFYADILFSVTGNTRKGWLKKSKNIGAFSRNEQEVQDLTLFTKPDYKDSNKINLTAWKSKFITIEKCDGEWRYVSLIYKGEKVSGWIEANKLCANNHSTCS